MPLIRPSPSGSNSPSNSSSHAQELVDTSGEDQTDLAAMIDHGLREHWRLHRDEPFRGQLWAAVHADTELTVLDLQDSRPNARVMARATAHLTGRTDVEVLERKILLMIELLDSLMRLVVQVDETEAEALVADLVELFVDAVSNP
ncbi:MAG: hypothetical protein HRT86_15040 [Ilumatobacteraceae bacterium]|nr:hypothetical protein [Ilumatobacteraceae bacterium]